MEKGKPFKSVQAPQATKRTWVPNKYGNAFEPLA